MTLHISSDWTRLNIIYFIWQDQGIFDLVQLSRVGPRYNPHMLLVATCFWETTTITFQLPCGMVTHFQALPKPFQLYFLPILLPKFHHLAIIIRCYMPFFVIIFFCMDVISADNLTSRHVTFLMHEESKHLHLPQIEVIFFSKIF